MSVTQTEEGVDQLHVDGAGLYEFVNGRWVEKVLGAYECGIASILGEYLAVFARAHRLGRVRVATPFLIAPPPQRLERRPDVSFVSYGRWARDRRMPRGSAGPVVPDLAVEVVSPKNTATEVQRKRHEYFRAGVRLDWVIYPDQYEIYVYTAPTAVSILTRNDEPDGGDVVPGFRLPVAALFEDEPESESGEAAGE
jgi:Uma2 family endonuclease